MDLRKQRFIISEQDPGPDLASVLLARLSEPGSSPELTMLDVSRENVLTMVSAANYATLTTDAAMGSTAPGVVLRNIYEPTGNTAQLEYAGYWRDHVAFEQRPIRIIRDYRVLTLPLHLRTRGRSVLPNMIAGDECHHPLHEAASPFPDPGVMSAGYLH